MYALITRDLTEILKEKHSVSIVPASELADTKPYWVEIIPSTDNQAVTQRTKSETVDIISADSVSRILLITDDESPEPNVYSIDKLQCKNQLVVLGLWISFKAALTADTEMLEDWELTNTLGINNPFIDVMAASLSLDKQVFFNAASKL